MIPIITVDGPSGAGKGTISRLLANRLKWNYLDSGSIYRSLAIACQNENVDLADAMQVSNIARKLDLNFSCGEQFVVILNGQEITSLLGTETVGNAASIVAAYPEVRAILLDKQHQFHRPPGLIADGRDMGSVVFPNATTKVFLTATAEERAKRRYKQLIEKGIDANLDGITQEIEMRDLRDQQRSTSPLMIPHGAVIIDSSKLSIDEVVEKVMNLVQ